MEIRMKFFSRKEKVTLNIDKVTLTIDKDVFFAFCVACAQNNVSEVLEEYMVSYIKSHREEQEKMPRVYKLTSRIRLPEPKNIHLFESWMKARRKSNGEFYAEGTVTSYLLCIRKMCYNENITDFNEFVKNIGYYDTLYNKGGEKEFAYEEDHGAGVAVLNLLKVYAEE